MVGRHPYATYVSHWHASLCTKESFRDSRPCMPDSPAQRPVQGISTYVHTGEQQSQGAYRRPAVVTGQASRLSQPPTKKDTTKTRRRPQETAIHSGRSVEPRHTHRVPFSTGRKGERQRGKKINHISDFQHVPPLHASRLLEARDMHCCTLRTSKPRYRRRQRSKALQVEP